jgi:hypothetical protein
MRQATWKIVISLAGAGTAAFGVFILLETLLSGGVRISAAGSALFRFQVSSMIAMGTFAGLAILIYVRLSRRD